MLFQKSDVKSHFKPHVEQKSGNAVEPGKPNVPIPPVAKKNRVPKVYKPSRAFLICVVRLLTNLPQ